MTSGQEEHLRFANCHSYLIKFRLCLYRKTCKAFSKDIWNGESVESDAVITELLFVPTPNCIAGFHKVRLNKIEIEKQKFGEFSYLYRIRFKPGGNKAISSKFYKVYVSILAFSKAGFVLGPLRMLFLFTPSCVPK